MPKYEKITFDHGDSKAIVTIDLVDERVPKNEDDDQADVKKEDDDEEISPKFKVFIEDPEPEMVKISAKKMCVVELSNSKEEAVTDKEHLRMIALFVGQENPTWGR